MGLSEQIITTHQRLRSVFPICLVILVVCFRGINGQRQSLRQSRQQPANIPQINGLDVQCEKSGMTVNLRFSGPFNGVIFSKGHFANPACRYVRKKSGAHNLKLVIPLSSCGTQTKETGPDRLMIENTLIIQMDPTIQDTWDTARKITCDWQSKLEKMVTFAPFSVSELLQSAEVKFMGSGDNVRTWMEIQFGRGPFAPPLQGLTKIGDELTVVIYADDGGAGYDMMIKNCYAYDSRNFNSKATNKIRLLNDHGCLFRPHLMEYFKRTTDSRSTNANIIAYGRMNAFKFPDKMDVFLSCELELCKGGCDTHCEMDDYPIDIIQNLGHISQPSGQTQETESVITTFRPAGNVNLRGLKRSRRRKPKKFATKRIDSKPVTLSPEIMELLEELGDENTRRVDGLLAQARMTETPSKSTTSIQSVNLPARHAEALNGNQHTNNLTTNPNSKASFSTILTPNSKASFSTILAGTHSISNQVPQQIIQNQQKFKPSQLLSASLDSNSGPFTDSIQSISKGNTGLGTSPLDSAQFPPRLPRQTLHAARLTNVLEQEISTGNAFFTPPKSETIIKANALTQHQDINPSQTNNYAFNANSNQNTNSPKININTLQSQLKGEGQFACLPGSTDPRCNPNSNQILMGFFPMSQQATANNLLSPVNYTPPKTAPSLETQLIGDNRPQKNQQQILVNIVEQSKNMRPPTRKKTPRTILADGPRKRFGTRLAHSTRRLVNFFGARKKRSANPGEVTDRSQTVNMVKGFQVISASDLAFDPSSLGGSGKSDWNDVEQDVCFPETSFYAGLITVFSILMISGLVSVCSIRKVRKYQNKQINKALFGEDPYEERDIFDNN